MVGLNVRDAEILSVLKLGRTNSADVSGILIFLLFTSGGRRPRLGVVLKQGGGLSKNEVGGPQGAGKMSAPTLWGGGGGLKFCFRGRNSTKLSLFDSLVLKSLQV